MGHDLLTQGTDCGFVGERTFYRLSLDISLAHVIRSSAAREAFMSVLASPLRRREEISERQAVVRDFLDHPAMLRTLQNLSKQLDDIRTSWNAYRRTKIGGGGGAARRSHSADARGRLSFSASTLGRLLYFMRDLKETLESYRPSSRTLTSMLAELKRAASGDSFDTLLTLCGELDRTAESGPINVRVSLDADGRITAVDLIDGSYIKITDPEVKTHRRIFSKEKIEVFRCERVFPTETEEKELMPTPFAELANVTDTIAKEIFDRYYDLGHALLFYEAAIDYASFFAGREITVVFPEFTDADGASVSELYDLALLTVKDKSEIVPHTFSMPKDARGIVIYGENGSGKTSFLRSLASAQLFAQAGLPIPAKSARLCVRSAIVEEFAESEKEFSAGNDAGRFEQEVRELAELIGKTPEGALLILNETFQSTSYDEGAEGLSHILRYFGRRGIFYILATHMRQLRPKMEGDALFLRMNDRFSPVPDAAEKSQ